jgi:hypothetical protein
LGWNLPTEGNAPGKDPSPDTADPVQAKITTPFGPGVEPEMQR